MKWTRLHFGFACAALLAAVGCTETQDPAVTCRQSVIEAEHAFAEAVRDSGISKGFLAFAADDAVVKRGEKLIQGRSALQTFYHDPPQPNETLTWEPDFVDVAASCDLAYTYGRYRYAAPDSTGKVQVSEGIFHTVWKKQADGQWKFVWD